MGDSYKGERGRPRGDRERETWRGRQGKGEGNTEMETRRERPEYRKRET